MQNQTPISFEIDIKAPSAAAPEIKKRLETDQRPQLTKEQLEERLHNAAQKRAARIEKQRQFANEE